MTMAKQRKKQLVQVVTLPPVYRQPSIEAVSESLKAQQRVDQLVGILVEAALVHLSELSEGEKSAEAV